jgi:hypothetical protein
MGGLLFRWIVLPIGLLATGFGAGWQVHDWRDAASDLRDVQHVVQVTRAQGAISAAVAVRDQAARDEIQTVTRTIVEKVPVHVTPAADARCLVPLGFVRAHNAAASGDLSGLSATAGQPDDAASGLALSTVARTVVANYGDCRGTARRLIDLQAWLAAQQAAAR